MPVLARRKRRAERVEWGGVAPVRAMAVPALSPAAVTVAPLASAVAAG